MGVIDSKKVGGWIGGLSHDRDAGFADAYRASGSLRVRR